MIRLLLKNTVCRTIFFSLQKDLSAIRYPSRKPGSNGSEAKINRALQVCGSVKLTGESIIIETRTECLFLASGTCYNWFSSKYEWRFVDPSNITKQFSLSVLSGLQASRTLLKWLWFTTTLPFMAKSSNLDGLCLYSTSAVCIAQFYHLNSERDQIRLVGTNRRFLSRRRLSYFVLYRETQGPP